MANADNRDETQPDVGTKKVAAKKKATPRKKAGTKKKTQTKKAAAVKKQPAAVATESSSQDAAALAAHTSLPSMDEASVEEQKKAQLSAKMEDMGLMPTNQTSQATPEAASAQEKPAKSALIKSALFWLGSLAIIGAVMFLWLQEPKRGEQQNEPQPTNTAVEAEKPGQPAAIPTTSKKPLSEEKDSLSGTTKSLGEKDKHTKADTREEAAAPSPTPSDAGVTAPAKQEPAEKPADVDTEAKTDGNPATPAGREPQPITPEQEAPKTEPESSSKQPGTKSPTDAIAEPEPSEKSAGVPSATTAEERRTGRAAPAAGTPYGGYPQQPPYPYYRPAPGYGYPPGPYPYPAQSETGR
uniref:Uncharacterized protein n=1 Tax=Candidatus Kentrum sp. DK TaxID=2126562 RepID=A0A450RTA3_9GAMM|nr:MAG: hypothetical protein BECKDK2373B_GA0170837_10017 [Candidatus Kentron sp. DK]